VPCHPQCHGYNCTFLFKDRLGETTSKGVGPVPNQSIEQSLNWGFRGHWACHHSRCWRHCHRDKWEYNWCSVGGRGRSSSRLYVRDLLFFGWDCQGYFCDAKNKCGLNKWGEREVKISPGAQARCFVLDYKQTWKCVYRLAIIHVCW